MIIGVVKEIKTHEYRVGLTPASVKELINCGHQVFVEHNAGAEIGFNDETYVLAGATITDKKAVFDNAKVIIKVKEPLLSEVELFHENQILFTYLHLAANPALTNALLAKKCTCIAYETVTDQNGGLPLLQPMSAVAGRLSVQAGATALEKVNQGAGLLLGGVPGVQAANVVIIGGGIVGNNAAQMAIGLGAKVTIIDKSPQILKNLAIQFGNQVQTIYATSDAISEFVKQADLLIGSVLIPGAAAPKVVSESDIKTMKKGAAVVDVAIDQGGCFETSAPTTHDKPTFIKHNVVHYCVTNMPGAVPKTSTAALNNATLPYILALCAADDLCDVLAKDNVINQGLRSGLNLYQGAVTHEPVAISLNKSYLPLASLMS